MDPRAPSLARQQRSYTMMQYHSDGSGARRWHCMLSWSTHISLGNFPTLQIIRPCPRLMQIPLVIGLGKTLEYSGIANLFR